MDAIQKDVSGELDKELESVEEGLESKQKLSEHESEIERIASIREENLETENEEQVVVEERENPLTMSDNEWYVSTKVNGEEVDVPWNEIVAQYQKNSSADKRLQEASSRQKELEDYERKLSAYRAQLEAQAKTQPSKPDADESPSVTDANTDALYGQYHDALFQGDETTASKLLKKIRGAEKPSQDIDIAGIIDRTKAEMRQEEKKARQEQYEKKRVDAVQMFHTEYSDIAGDPSLLAVADAHSAELYNKEPTRDPWEIMQECGEYAREWLMIYVDELSGSKDIERKERKQGLDEVNPRNVRASIGEDEAQQSYSDIIAEMRADRGQRA